MLVPICQAGEVKAYSGDVTITPEMIDGWVSNFGEHEKVPIGMGHLNPDYTLAETDKKPLCWISGLYRAGDYCMGMLTDWTPEGQEAALGNGFKNFSIETTGGEEDRIKYVAALGAYDSAVDFKTPDDERFQPFDFAKGTLGDTGRMMLAAAMGYVMPYKEPPAKITKLFEDEKGPNAWMKAYNAAHNQYNGDEAKANATAWAQIKEMGYVKGKDGKYQKSNKAAQAAKGGRMSFKEKVLAAMKDLTARLEGEPEEAATLVELEPVIAAAPPVGEPAKDPEVKALAARVEELDKQVKDQATELQMAGATTQAADLCRRAHLPPKFEAPMAQYLAGKAEIILAEPEVNEKGEVVKEYKLSRNEFFDRLLEDKGTTKLEDPAVLAEPPKKVAVKKVSLEEAMRVTRGPTDPGERAKLAVAAKVRQRKDKISLEDATEIVIAEYDEKEAA